VLKKTILSQKIIFFPIAEGGAYGYMDTITLNKQGRIQGANPARAPLKLEKNMIFLA
jgi:hypothetical protein